MRKIKEDEQTLEELNLAHRRSQAKCQLVQTSYIKNLTSVVCTDLTVFGLYLRPRSRFSHTDLLVG